MQEWIVANGKRLVVLFEGRDTAGKDGAIKRINAFLNPRTCRVVAVPTPSERERSQWFFQRYVAHLPAAGEIVLFDRSWYNRAGVERVMGFCTEEQYVEFLRFCPQFEEALQNDGIMLVKYWLSVSDDEQERRFKKRLSDPRKRWKFSDIDLQGGGARSRLAESRRRVGARGRLAGDLALAPARPLGEVDQRREVVAQRRRREAERPEQLARAGVVEARLDAEVGRVELRPPAAARRRRRRSAAARGRTAGRPARSARRWSAPTRRRRARPCRSTCSARRAARAGRGRRSRSARCRRRPSGSIATSSISPRENARIGQ